MNHGTLYRCLRRLEDRGLFVTSVSEPHDSHGPARVFYELTPAGVAEARSATLRLAQGSTPPVWIDADVARARLRGA